jgi:hypothetical protein
MVCRILKNDVSVGATLVERSANGWSVVRTVMVRPHNAFPQGMTGATMRKSRLLTSPSCDKSYLREKNDGQNG